MNLFDGRLRWVLVFWMFLISAVAYLDRVNISIAGQAIQKEYGLSNVQLGWIFSAFVIGYALFQAPGGRLADHFGPRRILTFGVVWWGVFTTLTVFVPVGASFTIALLITMRFVLGVGEAVVYPSSTLLVANWIPTAERGIANGFIFAGVGAGAGITPPLITWILLNWGWRWSFYISALIGLAAGLVWYIIARDTPAAHPWATEREKKYINDGIPSASKPAGGKGGLSWGAILGSKDFRAMTASYFAFGYVAYIFFTWFFIYLSRVRGLDMKSSALYSMLPFIGIATGSPVGGWIADVLSKKNRRIGRCGVPVVGMCLASVFLAMATQVQSAELASVVLAGGAASLYLAQSAFWAVTADIAGRSAGSASGLMNMGGQIGGAVTASLTPWVADQFGWTASFLLAAALCGVGGILWLFVDPDARIRSKDGEPFEAGEVSGH